MVQAILSDAHGERRAAALTEANIGAGVSAMLAPAVVGGFQRLGWGWRPAILLGVGLLLVLALSIPRKAIPNAAPLPPGSAAPRGLPRIFWAYWGVVFLAVAVEWCLMVWSADFLEKAAGFARPTAAALMSLFYLAYVLGRVEGAWLTRRWPADHILLLSFGIILLGFPLFWLPRLPLLNVLGLIVEGFGAANLFPLAMTAAVGAAPDRADAASARVSLALGSSVLLAPLALGALADGLGIRGAFGIVLPLAVLAIAVAWLASRTPADA
jgi:fucose permease